MCDKVSHIMKLYRENIMGINELTITCLQIKTEPGCRDNNLLRAEEMLQQISDHRPQLVVLPELFAIGYSPNESIFSSGEMEDGCTLSWMKHQSAKYGVYLGGGAAIYDQGDLFNRYYITGPKGEVCGYAQKENGETYCFKRGMGSFTVKTDLGLIGVLICADSHFKTLVEEIDKMKVDLLLLPHAWPSMEDGNNVELDMVSTIANYCGVPVIFVNGVGKMAPMQGVFGKLMKPSLFELRGKCLMMDQNGVVKGQLGNTPGILSAHLVLQKTVKKTKVLPDFDGWIHAGSSWLRKIIIPLDTSIGQRVYARNCKAFLEKASGGY